MRWNAAFQSHPRYEQAIRFTTGRPSWVLRATGWVAVVVFAVPLIAAALMLLAAGVLTACAWVGFSAIARLIESLTGAGASKGSGHPSSRDEGRENVRVVQRP